MDLRSARASFREVRRAVLGDKVKVEVNVEVEVEDSQSPADLEQMIVEIRGSASVLRLGPHAEAALLFLEGTRRANGDELDAASECFMNALNASEYVHRLDRGNVLVALVTLNALGILHSRRGGDEGARRAEEVLREAVGVYRRFVGCGERPADIGGELVGEDGDGAAYLEREHTLSLYYLAQVCGSLGRCEEAARYCHETLVRQLAAPEEERDPAEWALNAATLAMVLLEKGAVAAARSHLVAATEILDDHLRTLAGRTPGDDFERERLDADLETAERKSAELAICRIKFDLNLLAVSRERLLDDPEERVADAKDGSPVGEPPVALARLKFDRRSSSDREDPVPDGYPLVYEDARAVFLDAQTWIERAKRYFTLENFASDYVSIVSDASRLYESLIFFEEDDDRRAKMHKRRVDLLEGTVKELNPVYYGDACRRMWYELGDANSEILQIKLDKLRSDDGKPTPRALSKINRLVVESVNCYEKYLESLRDAKTGRFPTRFSEETARPALMAYFRIGRLHGKFITADGKARLDRTERSLQAYKTLVEYCESDEHARNVMSAELDACKSMVELLPVKIMQLKSANT